MATFSTTERDDLEWNVEVTGEAIAEAREAGIEPLAAVVKAHEAAKARLAQLVGNGRVTSYEAAEKRELTSRPKGGAAHANQYGPCQVRFATPKQVGFLKHLLQTRETSKIRDLAGLQAMVVKGEVSLKTASAAIDLLLGSKELAIPAATPAAERPVRANQYAAKCTQCGVWVEAGKGALDKTPAGKWAAKHIGTCPEVAPATAPAARFTPSLGMYRKAGTDRLVRVYFGRQSGRNLAKAVVLVTPATDTEPAEYKFEYLGAADRHVTAEDHKLTLDEAKAWGSATGTCCVCAAHLEDPTSVAAGIGPVCASRV